mgnify:CR=1 FL=1
MQYSKKKLFVALIIEKICGGLIRTRLFSVIKIYIFFVLPTHVKVAIKMQYCGL